jgi:hypothetical protein
MVPLPFPLSFPSSLRLFRSFRAFCISYQLYFTPHKAVILSEALCRSIANRGLYGAESKDPGDAYWQMLLRAFPPQTTPEDKKVTNSECNRISCFTALTSATACGSPQRGPHAVDRSHKARQEIRGSWRAVEGSAVRLNPKQKPLRVNSRI